MLVVALRKQRTHKKGSAYKQNMRKGDLGLSTTAIVVLIVAIVVLGFTITFIARGFGNVDELVEKEASKIAEPPQPTAANPVTLSMAPTAEIGGEFIAKVGVYNVCNGPIDILHTIKCRDPAGTAASITLERTALGTRELQPGQRTTMAYLATVSEDISEGRSLCVASVDAWPQNGDTCTLGTYTASGTVEFVQ